MFSNPFPKLVHQLPSTYPSMIQYIFSLLFTSSVEGRLSTRSLNQYMVGVHNLNPHRSYSMSIDSPFADVSWDEFRHTVLMSPQECSATSMKNRRSFRWSSDTIPDAIDWRDQGIVSPVKDQGQCGSCYSFSSTGALEAHHKIKYGSSTTDSTQVAFFKPLSEQQILDCSQNFDNHGCDGGLPSHVFEYVHYQGGIDDDGSYPYEMKSDGRCRFQSSHIAARTTSSFNITENDEESIKHIVATIGPVSVAFEVMDDFMLYSNGIYSSDKCRDTVTDVNHAVLIVGYGTDPVDGPYWIVKNSWGTSWGEDGYFRIARGKNMCGIAVCASYPILDSDNVEDQIAATDVMIE